MVSGLQNCYYSLSLFLPRPNIILSAFPYSDLGLIRDHKAQYYPTVFNPNGVTMTIIIFHTMMVGPYNLIYNIFLILV